MSVLHQLYTIRYINIYIYIYIYIFGKTVGDNVVGFKSRINQHISDCRTGTSTCKFPIHVYHCAMRNKSLKEPFKHLLICH